MISGFTIKNTKSPDKPNEDLIYFDRANGFVILLDGVSRDKINGVYPKPSPAVEAAKIIQKKSYSYYMEHIAFSKDPEDLLFKAAIYANEAVREYNTLKGYDFAAGAVGILGCLLKGDFFYLYIGDCYGRVIFQNDVFLFTTCQTDNIAKHKGEYTARQIRNEICNNPDHECGYGVINGVSTASCFMRTGRIEQGRFDRIVLSSDGPEDYLRRCNANILKRKTCKELIFASSNGKNQDDMAIVIIDPQV